jgi:hypothetical protein
LCNTIGQKHRQGCVDRITVIPFHWRGAGRPAVAFRLTAEMRAPRSFFERCSGELLGDYTDEAWRRVGEMLFFNYEPLTSYDFDLTQRYRDFGGQPSFGSGHRTFPPEELTRDVDRAYFRLRQHRKIDDWFEANGFDLEKPILKEEFERRFTVLSGARRGRPRKYNRTEMKAKTFALMDHPANFGLKIQNGMCRSVL